MSRGKKPAPLGFQFEDPEGRLRGPWTQIRGDLRKACGCCWFLADLGYDEPKVHGLTSWHPGLSLGNSHMGRGHRGGRFPGPAGLKTLRTLKRD